MLIPTAHAAASPTGPDLLVQFAPIAIIMVVFYFLLLRPQQKKMKEHQAMLAALQKGDEVATTGGTLGRVVKAGELYLTLDIAEGVEVVVQRSAVANKLDKGTIKANRGDDSNENPRAGVKLDKSPGRGHR